MKNMNEEFDDKLNEAKQKLALLSKAVENCDIESIVEHIDDFKDDERILKSYADPLRPEYLRVSDYEKADKDITNLKHEYFNTTIGKLNCECKKV